MRLIGSLALLSVSLVFAACAAQAPPAPAAPAAPDEASSRAAIAKVIDDWHDAAAHADEARYFGHFSTDAVFLGTDGTERWELAAFRAYSHPHFAKGKAWSFRSVERHLTFAQGSVVAWFDEALDTPNLGPARGSGVMVRDAATGRWAIAQYNLSVPIPNERFAEVKRIIAGRGDAGAP